MLPMNKVCEDIKAFLIQGEATAKLHYEEFKENQDRVILFANELSEKYGELVSVKLIKSFIVNIQDSMDNEKNPVNDTQGKL